MEHLGKMGGKMRHRVKLMVSLYFEGLEAQVWLGQFTGLMKLRCRFLIGSRKKKDGIKYNRSYWAAYSKI